MPCLPTWPSFHASFAYQPNLSAVTALPVGLTCVSCLHTLIACIAYLTFAFMPVCLHWPALPAWLSWLRVQPALMAWLPCQPCLHALLSYAFP